MMRLVVRPAAANDLTRAYRWYEDRRPGLGEDLLQEVQSVIDRMLLLPLGYPVAHRDTRRALIRRFPYGIFFRMDGDAVSPHDRSLRAQATGVDDLPGR